MTRINTNVSSLNAQKTLAKNQASLNQSMTRLSTGLRINSGADDPSGMIAAAIQSNDIASMKQAITNTQNGSMLIGTADSALGQITSLLTDIRSLVTQVGNTAVVNSDMIAANQLQVDSAIQAIDRISQVTTFQGQKILDGTLDFINNAQTIPQIQNLDVTQANLGATGQVGVTVQVAAHAERADITTSSGDQQATTALTFAARTEIVTGVEIQANSNSSEYDGVKYTFSLGAAAATGNVSYDSVSKTLNFQGQAGSDFDDVVAAINGDAVVSKLFTASGTSATLASAPTTATLHQTSFDITALNKGIDFNNVAVKIVGAATVTAATPTATYNESAKVLTLTVFNTGATAAARFTNATTFADLVTAINGVTLSDGTKAFTATYPTTGGDANDLVLGSLAVDQAALANTSVSGYINSAFSAGTRATGEISMAAGATLNSNTSTTIAFDDGAGHTGTMAIKALIPGQANFALVKAVGAGVDTFDGTTLTINTPATELTMQQIADKINAIVPSGTGGALQATVLTDSAPAGTFVNAELTLTTPTTSAAMVIKSTVLGDATDNVKVTFHNDATATGLETAVYDALKKTLDVHTNAASTVAQVVAAINKSTDSTTGLATGVWKATNLNPAATNLGAFSVVPDTFYTSTDKIKVQSLNTGANYNNMQVQFETVSSLSGGVNAVASYDAANNKFVIQVKNSELAADAVSLQDITDAIDLVGGFAGSWVSKTAAAGVSQSAGIIFGKSTDTTAIGNTGSTGGNALLADLNLEVSADQGQNVFTFKKGTTSNQVADAINTVSDATGAIATRDNGLIDIKSATYGTKGFVALNVLSEGAGGQFTTAVSSFRANGTDAVATINGITATSIGNQLSINTSSLALSLNLQAETNGNFNFAITGGGAQFQLGPDVVSNQQLRIGIQSLNTARLGGVSGRLYQLGSGNNAALNTNPNLGAKIVDDATNFVTTLRGRLGAIQGLTMATNQNTLTDMVQNAQTSLSLIQDTDFAAETANLTRAQILSQANMSVLSIANQQPQQVLALLPRG
jgi:flagellin